MTHIRCHKWDLVVGVKGGREICNPSTPLNPAFHLVFDLLLIILPSQQEVRFAPASPHPKLNNSPTFLHLWRCLTAARRLVGKALTPLFLYVLPPSPHTLLPPKLNVLVSGLRPIPLAHRSSGWRPLQIDFSRCESLRECRARVLKGSHCR